MLCDMDSAVTVGELLNSASKFLCDAEEGFENQLFSREQLLGFYNCAVSVVFSARKEAFIETIEHTLEPGRNQNLGPCIAQVLEVSNVEVDGEESQPSKEDDMMASKNKRLSDFFITSCCDRKIGENGKEIYRASSYSISSVGSNGEIKFEPPIPACKDAIATVKAVVYPNPVTLENADTTPIKFEFKAAIFEYMLYMARATESESPEELQISGRHLENALNLLGISYRSYARIAAKAAEDDNLFWRQSIRGVNA